VLTLTRSIADEIEKLVKRAAGRRGHPRAGS
jgi:hypothetical protein